MRRAINTEKIEGRLYQHSLEVKTVQNQTSKNYGNPFIAGTIEVAVDEEGLNVIPVHFTYVTPQTSTGKTNETYNILANIIENGKTWIANGKDEAMKLRVNPALALNEFYNQQDELVSTKTNEGGFISNIAELCAEEERNTFTVDMVITSTNLVEKDDAKDNYVTVKGAIFNFRNELLPVEFVVRHPEGMKHFENLDASNANPIYTKVWGKINCITTTTKITEESAFGKSSVRTVSRTLKEWEITGTAKVPYDFGDERFLTAEELSKAAQDREIMLAEMKKRSEEYRANKNTPTATVTPTTTEVKVGGFNF